MTWSSPRTWTTSELVTAAELNQEIRDNLNAIVPIGPQGWTSYVPTLTQGATVSKTVNYAKYMKVGRLVIVQAFMTCSSSGTAATAVLVGLPFTPALATSPLEVGTGTVFDLSASFAYKGQAIMNSAPGINFRASSTSTNVLGAADFTAALAAGDTISFTCSYESTT